MKETDFDISVRNILEGAEVPVSGKVWKGVAASLAPRHFVVPFWSYALSGVAVAAAIALGVFLFRPGNTDRAYQGAIAMAPSEINVTLADATVAVPIQKQIARSSSVGSTAAVEEPLAIEAQTAPEVSDANTIVKEVPSPVKAGAPAKATVTDDNAAFNRLAFQETKSRRPRLGMGASADIQSNSRGSFSRPGLFAPRRIAPDPDEPGIYNAYPEVAFGLPFSVGISATYGVSEKISFGIGLRYTRLTRTFVADYYDSVDGVALFPYLQTDIDNYQHWLGVPVNMYVDVLSSRYWHFHTFVGGTAEFLLNNDFLVHASPKDIHYQENNGYPPQFSLGAGVGIEFMIMDNVGLYFDPSLRYYLGTQKQPRSIRTVQPFRMDVEAGLRMYFGK